MVCPAPEKRKRAWAPKRRTGCRSCKIRRLRCGEERPICHRCVKSGFLCEWDAPSATTTSQTTPSHLQSQPSTNSSSTSSTTTTSSSNTFQSQRLASTDTTTNSTADTSLPRAPPKPHNQPKSLQLTTLPSALRTYYAPSSPYSALPDYIYLHYFLRHVGPLLSTTLAWREMWQTTIPQCAWTSAAVRHGIIALAACYEGMRSGRDREALVAGKVVESVRAFREEGLVQSGGGEDDGRGNGGGVDEEGRDGEKGMGMVGPRGGDLALIMCRVMASLAQAREDWDGAKMHMGFGARILREVSLGRRRAAMDGDGTGKVSEVARLMAPTYMNVLTEEDGGLLEQQQPPLGDQSLTPKQQYIWAEIVAFRAKFKAYYVPWLATLWDQVNRSLKAHLLTAWSTINHTVTSALYPDLVFFKDTDPVVPIREIRKQLEWRRQLHSLEELSEMADVVFSKIEEHLHGPPVPFPKAATQPLEDQLRICVENYMVQAWIYEPRMSAGTYWSNNPEPECSVELRLRQFSDAETIPTTYVDKDGVFGETDEMQNFYLEHVCPYRSGLMPNRVDGCPIYKLKSLRGEGGLFWDVL